MHFRGVHQELFSTITVANSDSSPSALIPQFFPAALQRVWWHALRGDAIVLVSGTLLPLAKSVAFALERELLWRGIETKRVHQTSKPAKRDKRVFEEVKDVFKHFPTPGVVATTGVR